METFFERNISLRREWGWCILFIILSSTWFSYCLNATLSFKDTLLHHKYACLGLQILKKIRTQANNISWGISITLLLHFRRTINLGR